MVQVRTKQHDKKKVENIFEMAVMELERGKPLDDVLFLVGLMKEELNTSAIL